MLDELVYVVMKGVIEVFIKLVVLVVMEKGIIVNVVDLGLTNIGWIIEELKYYLVWKFL